MRSHKVFLFHCTNVQTDRIVFGYTYKYSHHFIVFESLFRFSVF